MYIPNNDTQNYPSVDNNYWLKGALDTQLNKPTNQNSIKFPRLLSQRITKRYYETLGTSVINRPISPPLMNETLCKILIKSLHLAFLHHFRSLHQIDY